MVINGSLALPPAAKAHVTPAPDASSTIAMRLAILNAFMVSTSSNRWRRNSASALIVVRRRAHNALKYKSGLYALKYSRKQPFIIKSAV